jgi:hypothetical protein
MLKLWEVRQDGKRVATYYAKNEKHAVQRHKDDQMQYAASFRRSHGIGTLENLTAVQIEPHKD